MGKEQGARDKQRMTEGLQEAIPLEDLKEYHAVMKAMLLKYEERKPPAMPCYGTTSVRKDNTSHILFPGDYMIAADAKSKRKGTSGQA